MDGYENCYLCGQRDVVALDPSRPSNAIAHNPSIREDTVALKPQSQGPFNPLSIRLEKYLKRTNEVFNIIVLVVCCSGGNKREVKEKEEMELETAE